VTPGHATRSEKREPPKPADIEHEIEGIRSRMTTLVHELDHRRHEALDWRLQARRHRGLLALVAGGALLLIGGAVALSVLRRRRAPVGRAQEVWAGLTRAYEHPEKIARPEPSLSGRVLGSAAGALASAVTTGLAKRLFFPPLTR